MNWLLAALASSVGRKFLMAVTGLLLCLFVAVHLAGNMLLYVGEETYNAYAHALHSQEWLVKIAEVGLVILFAVHLGISTSLTLHNRAARRIEYELKETKQDRVLEFSPSGWMYATGIVVLVFLVVHVSEFTLGIRQPGEPGEAPFAKALRIMHDPLSLGLYVLGSLFLGVHLSHGVESAFASLGFSHPKYDPWIRCIGIAFAIVVAVGFASLPIWAAFTPLVPASAP